MCLMKEISSSLRRGHVSGHNTKLLQRSVACPYSFHMKIRMPEHETNVNVGAINVKVKWLKAPVKAFTMVGQYQRRVI